MNSYKERETEMGDCLRFLILWEIGCTTNKAMFGLGMNVRTVELGQVRTMDVAGSWGGNKGEVQVWACQYVRFVLSCV